MDPANTGLQGSFLNQGSGGDVIGRGARRRRAMDGVLPKVQARELHSPRGRRKHEVVDSVGVTHTTTYTVRVPPPRCST